MMLAKRLDPTCKTLYPQRRPTVTESKSAGLSRRDVIKTTGTIAAASAFAGMVVPQVHAGESSTIKVALAGCGGRGTGAAANAMSVRTAPTQPAAIAALFQSKLTRP